MTRDDARKWLVNRGFRKRPLFTYEHARYPSYRYVLHIRELRLQMYTLEGEWVTIFTIAYANASLTHDGRLTFSAPRET